MVIAQIVASGDEIFQFLDDGTIKRFTGTHENPLDWTQLDANRDVEGIAAGDELYKRHGNGEIFVYNHSNWDPIYSKKDKGYVEGTVEIVAAGAKLYQMNGFTNRVLQYECGSWRWFPAASDIMQIAVDGDYLYTYGTNGQVYEQRIDYDSTRLDSSSNTAEIVAGHGCLYQRHHDGQIYRYLKGFWDRVHGGKTTVQIAAGDAGLYRRDTNGQVWRYIHEDNVWKLIDKSHDNIDIVVAKWLYVRTEDDSIYRYTENNWVQLQ